MKALYQTLIKSTRLAYRQRSQFRMPVHSIRELRVKANEYHHGKDLWNRCVFTSSEKAVKVVYGPRR